MRYNETEKEAGRTKNIKYFWANTKYRKKLILSYLLIALIPFTFFSGIIGSLSLAQTRQNAVSHTAQMVEQVSRSVDVYISTIEKMADYLSITLLEKKVFDDGNWEKSQPEIQEILNNIAASHGEIAGILIATENDEYISSGMTRISRDAFKAEKWYARARSKPEQAVLLSSASGRNVVSKEDYSVDDVFSLAKVIKDRSGTVYGVILFDVRHEIIQDSINGITIGQNGFVFVTDKDDNMVYTPTNDVVYRVNSRWLDGDENIPVTADIGNASYQIRYTQSTYTGWKTVGVFYLEEIFAGFNRMLTVLVCGVAVIIAAVTLLSFNLADSVTKPIVKLQQLMQKAESGDMTVHFQTRYNDEIGELGNSFNHMIEQIDGLIHMVYREQKSKRNAELKSLQEQIKPHFLYNTLDTISWMARDYGADDIVHLVDALTSMFRIGLSHGRAFITVKEEITHVSNYLYIQQIRYKSKLKYEISADEALADCFVPKLILQPLVENAIYHGIKAKRGGGTVQIRVFAGENKLCFEVQDDGAGILPDKLGELNRSLADGSGAEEKNSFGIYYIQERIRLCYGKEYGLTLSSEPGAGTVSRVVIPLEREARAKEEL